MGSVTSDVVQRRITTRLAVPVLHSRIHRLLVAIMAPDLEVADLTRLIEQFPSVAARLMYAANSAWSAPATPISSLQQACLRLGLAFVRSVSMALAVSVPFRPQRCPAFDIGLHWAMALLTADTVTLLTPYRRATDGMDGATLRTAGLLHNIGLLWMADRLPQETNTALLEQTSDPSRSLRTHLQEHIGFDYCEAGGCLARAWKLPDPLPVVLTYHRDSGYQGHNADAVHLIGYAARLVAQELEASHPSNEPIVPPPTLDMKAPDVERIVTRIHEQIPDVRELAQALFNG